MSSNFPNIPDSSVPGQLAHVQPPESWIYDRDPANGIARATFNGEVYAQTINSPAAGVSAFNGRTGSVTLDLADVESAGGAPTVSPAFSGVPTVPTATSGTATTQAASTAFVAQAVAAGAGVTAFNGRTGAVQLTLGDVTSVGGAPLASPTLTGGPTAPTPVVTDNSSLLATTAYVNAWGAQNTVLSFNGRRGTVTLTLADVESVGGAPIASPTFTGTPVVPTAAPGTATGQAASTAFVENAITAGVSGVASFNGRAGAVTLLTSDVTGAGGAPTVSPVLTGTPTAPTAVAGTNTGQVATCAFVETAIGSIAPIVNSFNGRNGTVTLSLADVTGVGGAPLASPAFSGTPTVPTAAPGTNTTEAASCAFVEAAIAGVAGVSSFNTRQGAVTLQGSDISGAGGALLASPAFSGVPTVPTAAPGTNTTQAASTAFTAAAVAAGVSGYLPLAGGTMTGPITSTTSGNFGPSTIGGVTLSAGSLTTASGGNVTASGGGGLYGGGGCQVNAGIWPMYSTDTTFVLNAGGNARVVQYHSGYTIQCDIGAGFYYFYLTSALCASLDNGGNFHAAGTITQGSDARNKVDIEPMTEGLNAVLALQPKSFAWEKTPERQQWGFIAQDVEEVMPVAVRLIEGQENESSLALDTTPIIAALVNAVKELAAKVEALEGTHERRSTHRTQHH